MRTISCLNSPSVVGYFEQEKLNFGNCEPLVCVLPVRKLHRRINVASRCVSQLDVVRATCLVRTGLIGWIMNRHEQELMQVLTFVYW